MVCGPWICLAHESGELFVDLIAFPSLRALFEGTEEAGGNRRHLEGMTFFTPGPSPTQKNTHFCTCKITVRQISTYLFTIQPQKSHHPWSKEFLKREIEILWNLDYSQITGNPGIYHQVIMVRGTTWTNIHW